MRNIQEEVGKKIVNYFRTCEEKVVKVSLTILYICIYYNVKINKNIILSKLFS